MNILSLLLLPLLAQAMPPQGTINLKGSCTIVKASGAYTIPLHFTYGSHLHVLGYVGDDGGDYEINIANNGRNQFESTLGSVVIGFARANAVFRNPPVLCPRGPEEVRLACEEQNRLNNPPFVPARSDRFTRLINETGDVKYEVIGSFNPDGFKVTKISVPASKIIDFNAVKIETPVTSMGGAQVSCSLEAARN